AYPMQVGRAVPGAYRWLADHGDGGPLLELPASSWDLYRESLYMYFSTYHWLPILNGYTAYPPRTYTEIMDSARRMPDAQAVDEILARGHPRWILLHRAAVPRDQQLRWEAVLGRRLRKVAEFGDDLLFEAPADRGGRAEGAALRAPAETAQ